MAGNEDTGPALPHWVGVGRGVGAAVGRAEGADVAFGRGAIENAGEANDSAAVVARGLGGNADRVVAAPEHAAKPSTLMTVKARILSYGTMACPPVEMAGGVTRYLTSNYADPAEAVSERRVGSPCEWRSTAWVTSTPSREYDVDPTVARRSSGLIAPRG